MHDARPYDDLNRKNKRVNRNAQSRPFELPDGFRPISGKRLVRFPFRILQKTFNDLAK